MRLSSFSIAWSNIILLLWKRRFKDLADTGSLIFPTDILSLIECICGLFRQQSWCYKTQDEKHDLVETINSRHQE